MRHLTLLFAFAIAAPAAADVPTPTSSSGPYDCDGSRTTFAAGFKFLEASHVAVTVTNASGLVITTLAHANDYTVTGAGGASGTVTLTAGAKCPSGSTLKIRRVVPLTQATRFGTQKSFDPKAYEAAFDKVTMAVQQVERDKLPAPPKCPYGQVLTSLDGLALSCVTHVSAGGTASDTTTRTSQGTVTTTELRRRFASALNLKDDFGAVGNGIVDDTAAVQAAAGSGAPIYAPPGTYRVTAEIAVSGSFRLYGRDATIMTTVSSIFVANNDLTDFWLRDVKLTTTRNNLAVHTGALFYSDGYNIDGGVIEHVTFDNGSSDGNGVLLAVQSGKTIKNVAIRDCYFTGPSTGLEIVNHVDSVNRITGVRLVDNRFVHNGLKDDQFAGFAISLSGPHRYVDVARNDIRGYPYAGIEIVGKYTGPFDYTIHGNRLEATGRGIIIDRGTGAVSARFSRISIIGNIIRQNRFFQRFEQLIDSEIVANHIEATDGLISADRLNEFVSFSRSDRLVVSGNSINLDFPGAERNKATVTFRAWTNSVFAGNKVRTTGLDSLRFDGTTDAVTDNAVTGNQITLAPTGAGYYPVQFTGAGATRNVLAGNVITTSTGLTVVQTAGATGNVAEGTIKVRSDTGLVSRMDHSTWTIKGALDLSSEVTLGQSIRLDGTPSAGFTVTLPSRQANYYISNQTGQTATITATSGAPTIAAGARAFVFVTGTGVATLF
jgi:pectate lyase-like protein